MGEKDGGEGEADSMLSTEPDVVHDPEITT